MVTYLFCVGKCFEKKKFYYFIFIFQNEVDIFYAFFTDLQTKEKLNNLTSL